MADQNNPELAAPVAEAALPAAAPTTAPQATETTQPAAGTSVPSEPQNLIEMVNLGALPYVIAMYVVTALVLKLVDGFVERFAENLVSRRLLIKQINTLSAFLAYFIITLISVTLLFNFSPQALLALSGTIAVTVGFALKDVASSFLASVSLLINKPFQVGDRISFGGFYGEVTEIGLRSVRLQTLDDNQVTIPSNKFLLDPVASANAGALDCMVCMDFYITPATDHQRAKAIVTDALLASKYIYLAKDYVVLISNELTSMGTVVVKLTAKAYVYDARQEKAFASDVTDQVLRGFRDEGIAIPGG